VVARWARFAWAGPVGFDGVCPKAQQEHRNNSGNNIQLRELILRSSQQSCERNEEGYTEPEKRGGFTNRSQ